MQFSWNDLPGPLQDKLPCGTVGKMHLTGLARAAFHAENPQLGADMLLAAWESDPLDGMLAGQLLSFLPADGSPLRALFTALGQAWQPDQRIQHLQDRRRHDTLFPALEANLGSDERSLFHLQRALEHGPAHQPLAWARQFFEAPWPEKLRPAIEYALSGQEMLLGEFDRARDRCRGLYAALPLPGLLARLAECEYRLGNRDTALALWREGLSHRPWDVSGLLRAYDAADGLDQRTAPPEGGVNIFLYTFNKAEELDRALKALAEGDLHSGAVTVLDNGSTDDTPAVLSRWRERFGKDDFNVITLPVNIGAPAARNWLMHGPNVRENHWTVYLDDDAVVPADWLSRLGAAAVEYPLAGVWGCKVVDAHHPHVIQNADLHPRPDYGGDESSTIGEMSDLHHQVHDSGCFDFIRPCTSVTGCCHLFKTADLLESGDFDIRFAPSQFDDLDHDLGLARSGKTPVYQGHLAVRHMKRSGNLSRRGGMAYHNGLANHGKLKAKLGEEGWREIRGSSCSTLLDDIRRKAALFDEA